MLDSSLVEWPAGLPVPKLERKHDVSPRNESVRMESGRMRSRRLCVEALEVIEAQWVFLRDDFATFRDFFHGTLSQGELPFSMTTYEPLDNPARLREVERAYAFLEGTYQFSGDDTQVLVRAVLEVNAAGFAPIVTEIEKPGYEDPNPPVPLPDPEVTYGECLDFFTLAWDFATGDVVQTAVSPEGPWYQYIFARQTTAEYLVNPARKSVKINNSFNGERWLRIVDLNGNPKTQVCQPLPSLVAAPVYSVSNTVTSEFALVYCELGPGQSPPSVDPLIAKPISWLENDRISPTEMYLEPVARRQISFFLLGKEPDGTYTPAPPTVVSITGENARWTRNGAVPTKTTELPAGNNARAGTIGFAGKIIGRCFSGDCASPLAVMVIDRWVECANWVTTRSKLGNGDYQLWHCIAVLIEDELKQWCIGGNRDSMSFLFPPALMLPTAQGTAKNLACADLHDIANVEWDRLVCKHGQRDWPFGTLDATIFASARCAVSKKTMRDLVISRSSGWDASSPHFERTRFKIDYEEGIKHLSDPTNREIQGVCGPGGNFLYHIAYTLAEVAAFLGSWECAERSITARLEEWQIFMSLYDDNPMDLSPVVPTPEEPVVPDPPETVVDSYYEDFEDYEDGLAVPQDLNSGTGWTASWVLRESGITEGQEPWDDYGQWADGEALPCAEPDFVMGPGGEGWDGEWTVRSNASSLDYAEDWEAYEEGDIDLLAAYREGTGWALLLEDDTDSPLEGWWFGGNVSSGSEDWEAYEDGVLTAESVLDYSGDGSGFGSGEAGQWTLLGV